jgi:hypothetical protein
MPREVEVDSRSSSQNIMVYSGIETQFLNLEIVRV